MENARSGPNEALWLLLRLVAGGFLVPHGLQKVFGILGSPPPQMLNGMFEKAGLAPGSFFAALTGYMELGAGVLLALGLVTRVSALVAVGVLGGAIVLVNLSAGFFWTKGGIEYPAMWAVLCLCFTVRGGGPFSLDERLRRRPASTNPSR